jgi:glycosyltransferase involved in cell wall biosynthesis
MVADEIEATGWPVEALEVAPGLHWRLPMRLAKRLRAWQADIVHTHNERPLIYGAPAARLARVACVIHTKHGRGAGNSRRQNWLAAQAARLTDTFVGVSDDCARLAGEQGVPHNRIVTLHNGIDMHRFALAGPRLDGPAIVVARLCPDKDLATLFRAMAIVIQTAPGFRLEVAGDGPEKSALHQLTEQLNLANHVRFLGLVRDVPAVMQQARMFVLSSITEGVPLTLLEAMASGLPCVSTNVGGIPEVLRDGVNGLLVPPRDPHALAMAMLRLHGDDEVARRLGTAGRRCVEDHFDIRHMVARYERIYHTACGSMQAAHREVHGCASHT